MICRRSANQSRFVRSFPGRLSNDSLVVFLHATGTSYDEKCVPLSINLQLYKIDAVCTSCFPYLGIYCSDSANREVEYNEDCTLLTFEYSFHLPQDII
ncbi:hypothetical protein AC249_AIPGENE1943 [Exaiptasia diaphana]|nr:hypothetical protein AC249_AIPGENE1943 [Exaiptasia diaphana]